MKAVVITSSGHADVLQLQERPIPHYAPHELRIKVYAAGINRPDISQRQGKYPAPPGVVPDIPGLEVAGVVEALGNAVHSWRLGDNVCALVPGGGYAEYVSVDASHCLPVPAHMSYAEASCLPETVFTVWHNLFQRGKLHDGEGVLIHGGSGGIGTTAIQLAKLFGARVFATAGTPEKCEACERIGATICVNYRQEDFAEQLQGQRIDVILDSVGGIYFEKNVSLLMEDGRMVYINAVGGKHVNLDILKVMQKRLVITGSTLRARDAHFKSMLREEIQRNVWPLIEAGSFKPIIQQRFPLSMAAKAHELMESGNMMGKLVLDVM